MWQEPIGDDPVEIPPSLKDSDKATVSTATTACCFTPGSLIVKSFSNKTPRSTCGSSMFSPGEGFWSEAIKLADGLNAPVNGSVCHTDTEGKSHLRSTNDDKKEGALHDSDSGVHFTEMSKLVLGDKHSKELDKTGSPLPVKHFDFSFEDRNSDVVSGHHSNLDKKTAVNSIFSEESDCDLVGRRGLRTRSTLTRCTNAPQIEEVHEKQEMAIAVHAMETKSDVFSRVTDTPVNVLRSLTGKHGNDETCTPSSFLQSKDWLDLSSWLPSEICKIYRKKGVQKLYQWQVF